VEGIYLFIITTILITDEDWDQGAQIPYS